LRPLLVSIAVAASFAAAAQERRGGIAFHYATPLSARELAWYSRFEVLVTHDPLPRAQVDALHRRGTKLALYEWAVAFYGSLATPWQRALPQGALLNRAPLRGHLGAPDADAFYYDPVSGEHARERAKTIAQKLAGIGYDGVFLDATTSESVHPEALKEFARRHPSGDYDAAFAEFLGALRRSVKLVITNQGYRKAEHVLPYVDWDVSESLITYPRSGKFVLRPWNDPHDRWNSTAYLMRKLIAPVMKKYPRVRFEHLNYVDTPASPLVSEIIDIARRYDAEAFVTLPSLAAAIETEAYFERRGAGTAPDQPARRRRSGTPPSSAAGPAASRRRGGTAR